MNESYAPSPKINAFHHLRSWHSKEFRLELFHTDQHWWGKQILAYAFYDVRFGDEPIFQGADFGCPQFDDPESDHTISQLLGFLSLKPGDTDAEYFEDYSPRQMEWCEQHAEDLSLLVVEMQENQ